MPFITFVVPSKGRKTLANTILSIYNQFDDDCNAVVGFDGVNPTIETFHDEKIIPLHIKEKIGSGVNSAGAVRNYIIDDVLLYSTRELPNWFGLVDDDDTIYFLYVDDLKRESEKNPDADIIIFRMTYQDGTTLPPPLEKQNILELENKVGISFAFKREVYTGMDNKPPITFEPSSGEDFSFLKRAHEAGYKIYFSKLVNYYVSPLGVAEDRIPNGK